MKPELSRRKFITRSAGLLGSAVALPLLGTDRACAADTNTGELTGRLIFDGDPPPRKKLVVDKDVDCCGKFDIRDPSLIVAEDGGLANVFVYAITRGIPISPAISAAALKEIVLDNLDCIFQPHCMTIWAGRQTLRIVNSDPVAQNVAFTPRGDIPANIVLPVDAEATYTPRRRQTYPIPIACNYHPWESAYMLPRDNPYATITDAEGRFRIPGLPLGTIEFQLWHERPGPLTTSQIAGGRIARTIRAGVNDLGDICIAPNDLAVK